MSRFRCPCTDCNMPLRMGTLMCLRHWRMLPRTKQYLVNKTWREHKASGFEPIAYDAYIKARNAAIEYVNAQIKKDSPVAGDGVAA